MKKVVHTINKILILLLLFGFVACSSGEKITTVYGKYRNIKCPAYINKHSFNSLLKHKDNEKSITYKNK
jgi:hypothetical protein